MFQFSGFFFLGYAVQCVSKAFKTRNGKPVLTLQLTTRSKKQTVRPGFISTNKIYNFNSFERRVIFKPMHHLVKF